MTRTISWLPYGRPLASTFIAVMLVTISMSPAHGIVIRHDVDDALYVQDDYAYPAVFQVFERRGGVATLIAPQWALTAAHVGQDITRGHPVTIAGQSYLIDEVILHPNWSTKRTEMALLHLDRPAEAVDPIPPYVQEDEMGKVVTFVGRGDTGTGLTGPVASDHKLRAATNRVERVEGDMLVFRFDAPSDPNVTPLEGISGPGDSGGPALIETVDGLRLAGLSVAQSGRPKGQYGVWEFYTRVSAEVTWIRDVVPLADEVATGEERTTGPVEEVNSAAEPGTLPVDEVDTVEAPSNVPAGDVASGTRGSTVAVYLGLGISAGLALAGLAWWYRRRQPSRLE